MLKVIGAALAAFFVAGAAMFGLESLGLMNQRYVSTQVESIRRDTMIQSRAYSEASQRELYRLKLQYLQAKTPDEKATIRSYVLHEAEGMDSSRLPYDLQHFIASIGG